LAVLECGERGVRGSNLVEENPIVVGAEEDSSNAG